MSTNVTPGRFIGLVFLLLLPCYGLWYLLAPALVKPALGFAHLLMTHWMPGIVSAVQMDGTQALILTQFGELEGKLVSAQAVGHAIGLAVNTQILSYSIPFYSALMLATPGENKLARYANGIICLYVVLTLSLVCLCLKQLMTNLGHHYTDQGSLLQPSPNLIALLFQLSTLILPVLTPVVLWLWQSKDTPLLKGLLLPLTAKPDQP